MDKKSSRLVPLPTNAFVPERDVDKSPVLEARHIGIDFGGLTAVADFSLIIGRTEIAGLIGPNGAGKTTIFNLLTNVYRPTRGTIMLDGYNTFGKTTAQVNRMGIARTFQNIRLFSNMSVIDNVKVGLHNEIKENMFEAMTHMPMTRFISCSIRRIAIWNVSRIFTMFSISSAVSEGFIPAAGSSRRTMLGLVASARTISRRLCAP